MDQHRRDLIIDDLAGLLKQSPYLSHLLVCEPDGGVTAESDLVAAFQSEALKAMAETLDPLLSQNFNLLFPGFCAGNKDSDRVDFVYLFGAGRGLYRVKITLITAEAVRGLLSLRGARLLYENGRSDCGGGPFSEISPFVKEKNAESRGIDHLLIEVLLIGLGVRRAIQTSQVSLNYAESHNLKVALENLLVAATDRTNDLYARRRLPESLSLSEPGRGSLTDSEEVASGRAIHTHSSLSLLLHWAHSLAREAAPEVCDRYKESIDFYFRCFDERAERSA